MTESKEKKLKSKHYAIVLINEELKLIFNVSNVIQRNQGLESVNNLQKRLKLFNHWPIPHIGAVDVSHEHGRCSSKHIRVGKANTLLSVCLIGEGE